MDFSALIPTDFNPNIFSSLTTASETVFVAPKKVELLGHFVTGFTMLSEDDMSPTNFAFAYFDDIKLDFMKNQDTIQILSNELLGHTKPLGEFEQNVLNKSYSRLLKAAPTRSNRL